MRFYWGFCEKRVFGDGFLMVNLWWFEAFSWLLAGMFSEAKNFPLFRDLFLSFVWKRTGRRTRFGNGALKLSHRVDSSLSHSAFAAVIGDDGLTGLGGSWHA